jgi:hypothetical protein
MMCFKRLKSHFWSQIRSSALSNFSMHSLEYQGKSQAKIMTSARPAQSDLRSLTLFSFSQSVNVALISFDYSRRLSDEGAVAPCASTVREGVAERQHAGWAGKDIIVHSRAVLKLELKVEASPPRGGRCHIR